MHVRWQDALRIRFKFNSCPLADNSKCRQWHKMTDKKKLKLGIHGASPWAGRAGILVRGTSRQMTKWNFLHSLLDIRWSEYCKVKGLNQWSDPAPVALWTDVRQNCERQNKDGVVTQMSKSLVYWHCKDRIHCPEEALIHQGWTDTFVTKGVTNPVPNWPEHLLSSKRGARVVSACDGQVAGRRRRTVCRVADVGNAIVDLAGNAMSLPDLAIMKYGLYLAGANDMWEHPPIDSFEDLLNVGDAKVELDPHAMSADQKAYCAEMSIDQAELQVQHVPGDESGDSSAD